MSPVVQKRTCGGNREFLFYPSALPCNRNPSRSRSALQRRRQRGAALAQSGERSIRRLARSVRIRSNVPRNGTIRYEAIQDRKSTRLNSSHANISYAVFCLKKKK